jgi:hypothetical protein
MASPKKQVDKKRNGSPQYKFDIESNKFLEVKGGPVEKVKLTTAQLLKKRRSRVQADAIAMRLLQSALMAEQAPLPGKPAPSDVYTDIK